MFFFIGINFNIIFNIILKSLLIVSKNECVILHDIFYLIPVKSYTIGLFV